MPLCYGGCPWTKAISLEVLEWCGFWDYILLLALSIKHPWFSLIHLFPCFQQAYPHLLYFVLEFDCFCQHLSLELIFPHLLYLVLEIDCCRHVPLLNLQRIDWHHHCCRHMSLLDIQRTHCLHPLIKYIRIHLNGNLCQILYVLNNCQILFVLDFHVCRQQNHGYCVQNGWHHLDSLLGP